VRSPEIITSPTDAKVPQFILVELFVYYHLCYVVFDSHMALIYFQFMFTFVDGRSCAWYSSDTIWILRYGWLVGFSEYARVILLMHKENIMQSKWARYSTQAYRLIAEGKQSRVYLGQSILKQIGVGKNLIKEEADSLVVGLCDYNKILHLRGWLIPELYSVRTKYSKYGWELFIYEQYIPGLLLAEVIVHQGIVQAMTYLLPILEILVAEPTTELSYGNAVLHHFSYGVDLKPTNLILNHQTKELFLVDIFAPKTMTSDKAWRCYNNKLESLSPRNLQIVTATREGILLRLLRLTGVYKEMSEYRTLLTLIEDAGINLNELHFVKTQIDQGYPLLDHVYQ